MGWNVWQNKSRYLLASLLGFGYKNDTINRLAYASAKNVGQSRDFKSDLKRRGRWGRRRGRMREEKDSLL